MAKSGSGGPGRPAERISSTPEQRAAVIAETIGVPGPIREWILDVIRENEHDGGIEALEERHAPVLSVVIFVGKNLINDAQILELARTEQGRVFLLQLMSHYELVRKSLPNLKEPGKVPDEQTVQKAIMKPSAINAYEAECQRLGISMLPLHPSRDSRSFFYSGTMVSKMQPLPDVTKWAMEIQRDHDLLEQKITRIANVLLNQHTLTGPRREVPRARAAREDQDPAPVPHVALVPVGAARPPARRPARVRPASPPEAAATQELIDDNRRLFDELQGAIRRLTDMRDGLETEVRGLEERKERLESRIKNLQETAEDYKRIKDEKRDSLQRLNREIEDCRRSSDEEEAAVDREIKEKRAKLTRLSDELMQLERQKQSLLQEAYGLRREKEDHSRDMEELRRQRAVLESEIRGLHAERDEASEAAAAATAEAARPDEEKLARLRGECDTAASELEAQRAERNRLAAEVADLKREKAGIISQLKRAVEASEEPSMEV